MYLKSIEMHGFKSFAGKMKLEFNDGITAIVGPNGSGKSNISDAVRWVLGEQSAKQLRGGNMQDIIFAGTESRRPLGFASVAIAFDNSDHNLKIDFDEVTITRRLYRSGESEYLINGSSCRLKDIHELFYDTGIGKEGYSMIGQGQIDKILNGKAEDRRELFDEACGIVKFKRRKIETLRKLEKEEENLVRVSDILNEITKQVGPLERQSQKARIYLSKKEILKGFDIDLFILKEAIIEQSLGTLGEDYMNIIADLNDADRDYEHARIKYEEIEEKLVELENEIKIVSGEDSRLNEGRKQLIEKVGAIREQIKIAELNIKMLEEQTEKLNSNKERHLNTLEDYKQSIIELARLIISQAKQSEEKSELLESIRKQITAENEIAAEYNNQLIELLNLKSAAKENKQKYITLVEQNQVMESALNARVVKLNDSQRSQKNDEFQYKQSFDNLCLEIEEKEKLALTYDEKQNSLTKKIADADEILNKSSIAYHRAQSMLESLINLSERYEGFGNSVKKVMEQKDKNLGIMGVVAELITTDAKYELAIETALGGTLQNIVTDNEATAKYLIEYLKRGKFGRATFLPLTTVGDKDLKDNELSAEGVVGRASDLIQCDEKYRPLVNRLLGKTYVIDNIDHAIKIGRKYSQKYRMVTIEGELINPGGSMTGGSYRNNSNLLGRQRQIDELKEETKKLQKEIQKQESIIAEARDKRGEIRAKAASLDSELKELSLKKNTAENNLNAALRQSALLHDDVNTIEKERAELLSKRREITANIQKADNELNEIAEREAQLENKITSNAEMLEAHSVKEREAAEENEKAKSDYNAICQKKEFLQTSLSELEREIKSIDDEILTNREKIKESRSANAENSKVLEEMENAVSAYSDDYDAVRIKLDELNKSKEALNQEYKALFKTREELSEQRSLLDKESFRLESLIEKQEAERDRFIEYLREEYEITPLQLDRDKEITMSQKELQSEISKLKSEIKSLGNVNVNSIDEYKEIKGRYEFLSAQHTDLVDAAQKLKDIISELDKSMRKQFAVQFENINKEFQDVFCQLFGGGCGTLELMDEGDILETGIRVVAQPPGKKLQNMMQLSGGEKTLTAIALLFAIQNLKPSPFCLLDEIEAALDDANVDRFAQYLHKLSDNIQFIVITHRRGTMTAANRLYGITMQEKGISTMVSVDLIESKLS